jgi:methylamine dehydrogenase heavy chain
MDAAGVKPAGKWSLVTDKERKDNWRISGVQHTAIHRSKGLFYVLMHQGAPETREEPGTEVWVYDVHSQQRVSRIELKELSLGIGVSQGAVPRLYSVDFFVPMPYLAMLWVYFTQGQDGIMKVLQNCVTIYDTQNGKLLHKIDGLPVGYLNMVLPW